MPYIRSKRILKTVSADNISILHTNIIYTIRYPLKYFNGYQIWIFT